MVLKKLEYSRTKKPSSFTAILHRSRTCNVPEIQRSVWSTGSSVGFFSRWDVIRTEQSQRIWVLAESAPVLHMIKPEENKDIISSSRRGFIWWPQFRS